jgi:hypothetical protein
MIRYEWAFILFSLGATAIAWLRDRRQGAR